MSPILLATAVIGLVLAIVILIIEVAFIKHQDKMRRDYFIFKKRARVLREFKEIYYSYCIYRAQNSEDIIYLLTSEKLNILSRNNFFGKNEELFNNLGLDQKYTKFLESINQLDLLFDDFSVLYSGEEVYPIQSFIFWYRAFILEIASYKKSENSSPSTLSIELKMKSLESIYGQISESFVLNKLENQVKIKG